MDVAVTALRVVVSLAVVLGLIWFLARSARRRGLGNSVDVQRFSVVARHSLGRNAGVAVVRIGDEALVLGVTEQSVQLLARTPVSEVMATAAAPAAAVAERVDLVAATTAGHDAGALAATDALTTGLTTETDARGRAPLTGPLAGSALSPATWNRAVDVLRERTTRR